MTAGPLVEFPNSVLWVTGYLRTELAAHGYPGIRVADTYKGEAASEVWVQRDGGWQVDFFREMARIRINVFAKGANSGPVDNLAARVSTLMRACADGNPVLRCEQTTGPTPIADTNPRRYLLFDLLVRGEQL